MYNISKKQTFEFINLNHSSGIENQVKFINNNNKILMK